MHVHYGISQGKTWLTPWSLGSLDWLECKFLFLLKFLFNLIGGLNDRFHETWSKTCGSRFTRLPWVANFRHRFVRVTGTGFSKLLEGGGWDFNTFPEGAAPWRWPYSLSQTNFSFPFLFCDWVLFSFVFFFIFLITCFFFFFFSYVFRIFFVHLWNHDSLSLGLPCYLCNAQDFYLNINIIYLVLSISISNLVKINNNIIYVKW